MNLTQAELVGLRQAVSHRLVTLRDELLAPWLTDDERREAADERIRMAALLEKLCRAPAANVARGIRKQHAVATRSVDHA